MVDREVLIENVLQDLRTYNEKLLVEIRIENLLVQKLLQRG